MAKEIFKPVKFIPKSGDKDFGEAIKKRVSTYFKENKKSRLGDYRIWIKVIVLPVLYLVPFVLLLTNSFNDSLLIFYGLWLLMGIGMAGSGLGIMHDACHGAISKKDG